MTLLSLAAGLGLLIIGAEMLVKGASRIATKLGVSPLIIGLTVVSFGTSSPELAVSVKAALSGQASIALGNVIGSNIFNVLFILGLSALIAPLLVSRQLIRIDVPLMIAVSVLTLLLGLDGGYSPLEGMLLVAGLLAYVGFLVVQGRKENSESSQEKNNRTSDSAGRWLLNLTLVLGGLALLVLGSRWLVNGAVTTARYLGISELIVGLTIVAAGTSLPEVVTSVIASLRGERDIAVGNVVGSNLFNLLGVLGVAALVAPGEIAVSDSVIRFDLPIMIATAIACLPIFFSGGRISRGEGALLLAYYAAYTLYLILAATHHAGLAGFGVAMLFFVIPITGITLVAIALRDGRLRRSGKTNDP